MIASSCILLAAVFAALGVLPLVVLARLGTVICIGVLLDTLVVRTLLVPAMAQILGDRFWWPRRILSARRSRGGAPHGRRAHPVRSCSEPPPAARSARVLADRARETEMVAQGRAGGALAEQAALAQQRHDGLDEERRDRRGRTAA